MNQYYYHHPKRIQLLPNALIVIIRLLIENSSDSISLHTYVIKIIVVFCVIVFTNIEVIYCPICFRMRSRGIRFHHFCLYSLFQEIVRSTFVANIIDTVPILMITYNDFISTRPKEMMALLINRVVLDLPYMVPFILAIFQKIWMNQHGTSGVHIVITLRIMAGMFGNN